VCVLSCASPKRCTDRDGVAPLYCADTSSGDVCLSQAHAANSNCADVPGTINTTVSGASGGSDDVCLPYSW
jgi:hypothetical protein